MWIFQEESPTKWIVGFFNQRNGDFNYLYEFLSKEQAAEKVHYLNGGTEIQHESTVLKKMSDLDFSNKEKLVYWCLSFEKLGRLSSYEIRIILKALEIKGFYPDMNCEDKLNIKNPVNFSHYIVGQVMSCLSYFGAVPDSVFRFCRIWIGKNVKGEKFE